MLPWLVVLAVALAATDAQDDLLDMASNWQGPDKVCVDMGSNYPITVNCTLPSGNVMLRLSYTYGRQLFISCSQNSTLVCDELRVAKPIFDKYNDTSSKNKMLNNLYIDRCNLPRERLACLLSVVGANGTGLVQVYLDGFAGKLEPVHLEGLEGVTTLYIQYDADESVAFVPYNALSVLPNLEYFSMYNASVKLTSETNHVLSTLTALLLVRCRIKSVPNGAFKAAPEIQRLSLMDNIIEFIDVDAFEGLTKLEMLDLSENLLTHLPGGVFRHTPNIEYLYLNKNKLLDLSDDLFTGLNKLKEIIIFENNAVLKLSNKTFSNLPSLYGLYLVSCFIENISAELFRNSTNFKTISLKENNITNLPNNIFKGLELTYLDLSRNKISYLNSDVFSEQTSMTELILSHNDLKSLPGELFSNMNSLKILDLGQNSIGFLNESTFTGLYKLEKLSLTDNRIEYLDKETFEKIGPTLQELNLSKNKLTISTEKNVEKFELYYFSPLRLLTQLKTLDLSHNNISVYCDDWVFMGLSELDLSYNNIISLSYIEFYFIRHINVDLRYNNIQQLVPPINLTYPPGTTFLMDHNPYRCDCDLYNFIHHYKLGTNMFNIQIEQAECAQPPALKGVKLVNLQLEELTCDVDCRTRDIIKHPSNDTNCKCILNKFRLRIEMICDYLPDVYPKLPDEGKYTYYLKLRYVTDVPLLPAEVKTVDFSSLNLTEPPIANSVALSLTNNYLTKAPLELFQRNCSVYLSNNPFDCTCGGKDNVLALNAFKNLIPDYKNLTCSNGISVSNTVVEQLCAVRNGIIISLSLSIVGIIIIICTIIAFKYTAELRIILRELGLWRGDVLGGEIYDAFVTFAHQDEDFVREKLLPKLEKGKPPLKICIHSRDWVIGDYIPAQISRSVDQSRYTIIVLTTNFVESMWGRMEFRTAHAKDRAIILMLDDLSADKSLDPELRAYISTKTYVKADDPLVWERLRDAVLRRRRGNSKPNKLTTTVMDCDA